MAEVMRMPKMSDTMEEGVIASWLVKVGDTVASGDILAEVETDKATMELESYEDGTILYLAVAEKGAVPVDGVLAIIGEEGEDYQHLLEEQSSESQAQNQDQEQQEQEAPAAIDTSSIPAEVITMPHMSDTMTEGTIANWLVKVGDQVASGDILAEVETDKATMELENYHDGTVLYLAVEAGGSVPVDEVIAIIGEEGADYQALLKAQKQGQKQEDKSEESSAQTAAEAAAAAASTLDEDAESNSETGRIKASPLAKSMAKEKGYDLSKIKGTGDGGRIVKRDIENYTPADTAAAEAPAAALAAQKGEAAPAFVPAAAPLGEESTEEMPVSQMRKTIAKRLAESKFTAPHFYLTMEINMDKVIPARQSMNEISPVKLSFNDIIIKAAAAALRQHPQVNSSWLGDKIRTNHHVHIGVAVAVDEGLLVPVVRFADQKPLSQISSEIKELGEKARTKKLQPSDWEGNTFTISNLGMFGIEEFTAIINPPDSCIMAVGGIKQTPVVRDGEIVVGNVMKVTLSCDHRVVDGAVGSAFLKTFKGLLEDPIKLLV